MSPRIPRAYRGGRRVHPKPRDGAGPPAHRLEDRVKCLVMLLMVATACGTSARDDQRPPAGLVAVDAVPMPPGVDRAAIGETVWVRYQEISNHPCSSAVRVTIDVAGEVSAVTERAYDCTGVVAPRYRRVRSLSPAERSALRAAIDASGLWNFAPAYASADHVNDGIFARLEVHAEGRARVVDYQQVEDPRLAPVLAILRRR